MIKSIIKEVGIMFLLCIAIILVFGIVFYNYIPMNKVVPNKVAYNVPEEVRTELESNISVEEIKPEPITYSVTSEDLKTYEASGDYPRGNPNPFQAYTSSNQNGTIIQGNNVTGQTGKNNTTHYYPTNTSTK